jgi:phosphoglycolate phosphatase
VARRRRPPGKRLAIKSGVRRRQGGHQDGGQPGGRCPVHLGEVARIKLEVFGLDGHFDLASGAYGDDDPERPKLVTVAQRRAGELTGVAFNSDTTVLVGDTPKDVEAGMQAGVHVIGVAAGKSSGPQLRDAGAHEVADDLDQCRDMLKQLALPRCPQAT